MQGYAGQGYPGGQAYAAQQYAAQPDPAQWGAATAYDPNSGMYGAQAAGGMYYNPPTYRVSMGQGEEEPMYVNAKQYHRILKRREARSKLEQKYKIERGRPGFMHQSRHKHALRRVRGPGGRFTKKGEDEDDDENSQTGASSVNMPSDLHANNSNAPTNQSS
ncbi:hypothetical protein SARC_07473 [Sphaeroforma arctica JP610]|uniref:Nuclear transcription factor Y subunit n=1 Tax=Sphaeroforma arctica JP610 TaxID=667725 RepID=A0A0L0FTM2_9EUKA|nr:hypothetical protein SARC_07473 [Sphaeroforma arctica JP610]KNC80160.1 hypothetical protein SARC_07473 [Sphaeroforma arctica JP610]|eukprot:XP_014154062.1 hypothetical protein SARC_07473 [Sphaeroforma arctica JP610]